MFGSTRAPEQLGSGVSGEGGAGRGEFCGKSLSERDPTPNLSRKDTHGLPRDNACPPTGPLTPLAATTRPRSRISPQILLNAVLGL